jgi:hypothetical protein
MRQSIGVHITIVKKTLILKVPVVIASAYRTKDPRFESHQGVRFLGIYTLQCCCHNLICIVIVCT